MKKNRVRSLLALGLSLTMMVSKYNGVWKTAEA